MNKSDIRKIHLANRRGIASKDVIEKSTIIQNKIFNSGWYRNSSTLMVYVSFQNEVDTHKVIINALNLGKKVIVPVCSDKNTIIPVEITALTEMKANKYGIL